MAATTGNIAVVAREVLGRTVGQGNVGMIAREILVDGRTAGQIARLAREALVAGGGLRQPRQYEVMVMT